MICQVRIENFDNSVIVAYYRIFWDDLYMHQVMHSVSHSGLEDSGRNTLMISYGAWGMSSYHMDTVLRK